MKGILKNAVDSAEVFVFVKFKFPRLLGLVYLAGDIETDHPGGGGGFTDILDKYMPEFELVYVLANRTVDGLLLKAT